MELVRGIHNLGTAHQGCVLTIGNFDGVHLGHQAVLSHLIERAHNASLPATVMIFEPQPSEFFAPDSAPARLTPLRDKYHQLKKLGIDRLICVAFNHHFAGMSASAFIDELLVKRLKVRHLVVGDDFRFGVNRTGHFDTLAEAGERCGFDVASMATYTSEQCMGGLRVSSTLIRQRLQEGNFREVAALLGREFSIYGRVVYGQQLGRTIGTPTANILLKRFQSPLHGVFIVEVDGVADKPVAGVANIGSRPTVNGEGMQLEVHLFGYSGQLYHRHLRVRIKEKLREEKQFDSLNALKAQIEQDLASARAYFAL